MFSGVGGAGAGACQGRKWKWGLMWWGEGRKIVSTGERERFMRCGKVVGSLLPPWSCAGYEMVGGVLVCCESSWSLLPAQKSDQKRRKCSVTLPLSSMQPSNQSSQLTLQLGRNTLCRSMMMNLGCMTLNGRTNMDLISRSSPDSASGAGSPNWLSHFEGW